MLSNICEICYKTFKTKQHLTQHKNKKSKCKPIIQDDVYKNYIDDFNVNTILENLEIVKQREMSSSNKSNNANNNFEHETTTETTPETTTETTPETITDINNEYDNTNENISLNYSEISESNKVKLSVENLTVTNMLEFINNYQKILEEKNKIENLLVILKKKVHKLATENLEFKTQINIVNKFIANYKNPHIKTQPQTI